MLKILLDVTGLDALSLIVGGFIFYGLQSLHKKWRKQHRLGTYEKATITRKKNETKKKNDQNILCMIKTIINYEVKEIDFPTRFRLIVLEIGKHYEVNMALFQSQEWLSLIGNIRDESRGRSIEPKVKETKEEKVAPPVRSRSKSKRIEKTPEKPEVSPEVNTSIQPASPFAFGLKEQLAIGKNQLKKVSAETKKVEKQFGGLLGELLARRGHIEPEENNDSEEDEFK